VHDRRMRRFQDDIRRVTCGGQLTSTANPTRVVRRRGARANRRPRARMEPVYLDLRARAARHAAS
jgi:hypothetical protein